MSSSGIIRGRIEPHQAKCEQLRDHIAGLESAADSVETAASTRPAGPERDQMVGLASRLRRNVEKLRDELQALHLLPISSAARLNAADRD